MRAAGQPRWAHKSYGPPIDDEESVNGYGVSKRLGSGYGALFAYGLDHHQGSGRGVPVLVEEDSPEMALVVMAAMMS